MPRESEQQFHLGRGHAEDRQSEESHHFDESAMNSEVKEESDQEMKEEDKESEE